MMHTVPFGTSLFDQPQILLDAIATCRNVQATARKGIKDYSDKNDYTIKRIVDIIKMEHLDIEQYRDRLIKICGYQVIENGRLSIPHLQKLDLGLIIPDIVDKLGGEYDPS
jgi:hypothetical protein